MFLRKFIPLARHYYSQKSIGNVVVVGAVRTPFHNEANQPKAQQAASIIDEVIKRAALPREIIDEVQLVGLKAEEFEKIRGSCEQLPKNIYFEESSNALTSLLNAIEKLNAEKAKVVVVCGIESKALDEHEYLDDGDDFSAEIMPILSRTKRCFITKDEFERNKPVSIATAIALTKPEHTRKFNITPLASLTHENCTAESDVAKVLKDFLQKEHINRWELLMPRDIMEKLKTDLEFKASKVNCYNLIDLLQQMPTIGPTVLLTHLVHNLHYKQNGFMGFSDEKHLFASMLVEKSSPLQTKDQPTLTLYTKNFCPLCDELIEELEQNFKNEYHLEKVFIDRKENIRFLRLYRHDIPVLFLNGQFVCMHRLNKNLLRKMLSISNNVKK